jgi:molybdopterin-guanine dinucleotide biosynthesis protein A
MSEHQAVAGGFVLAGGRSSRMGTDKALLWIGGTTLLERVAEQVRAAAGAVTIIADPTRYAQFGYPAIADIRSGCGPLGGIVTALENTVHEWNLVVACDLPNVDSGFLRELLGAAERQPRACDCVVPMSARGPEPLCAAYHRNALAALRDALNRNLFKMQHVLRLLTPAFIAPADPHMFENINTPQDWEAHGRGLSPLY